MKRKSDSWRKPYKTNILYNQKKVRTYCVPHFFCVFKTFHSNGLRIYYKILKFSSLLIFILLA
ncbi:hypothetical protein C3733_14170 [Bacillus amyloliquefaciens]|nr:hypothetical protein C3733_14170 [Bacillus amyloliquefaciens]